MEELKEALHTYRESLAELDSIRHTSQSVADSQQVCTAGSLTLICSPTCSPSVKTPCMQVYDELQEAIALTDEALRDLQSTEALKRGRQGTTEPFPASEAALFPEHTNATNVQSLLQTTLAAWKQSDVAQLSPAG